MIYFLQHVLPQHFISRVAGKVVRCRFVWLKNWLIRRFIAHYKVNMEEAITSSVESYPDFNCFFTRSLKPNIRPIASEQYDMVSPVDGCLSQIGNISNNFLIQAKGKNYTLQQLLVLPDLCVAFHDGNFATFYLSPRDYHRVHMPIAGKLRQMIYIPGTLFAVNDDAVNNIPYLFGRNERVITIFDTDAGMMALIMVGALMVGTVSTTWSGTIMPSTEKPNNIRQGNYQINKNNKSNLDIQIWSYTNTNLVLQRGDEMGQFQFGSTVILLYQKDMMQWINTLALNEQVKMGQKIGNTLS